MNKERFLLIRTHRDYGAGGPVPPLGILYIISSIRKSFPDTYEFKIIDTGLEELSLAEIKNELEKFKPGFIGFSTLSCEADFMHEIAVAAREILKDVVIIAGGPYATVAQEYLLEDRNIDYAVIGEGESTIVDLLVALESSRPLSTVCGIAYREDGRIVITKPRAFIENLDEISFPAWDMIKPREYSKFSNWNGILKESFYLPLITSRGCPYHCIYCHDIFGKKVRVRSPENVFAEIKFLCQDFKVKELHIIDDMFNFDLPRAKKICSLIKDYGKRLSIAFPNGLRADWMTDDLIYLLKKAGTYKINYGFETIVPRLQQMIKKELDIPKAIDVSRKTADAGIITGGYFMFGFPTETKEEVLQTINFAVNSNLDIGYFFKVTPFPRTELYKSLPALTRPKPGSGVNGLYFYSSQAAAGEIPAPELNYLIICAQKRFFLNSRRIWRGLVKTPNKISFLKNTVVLLALIIHSYLIVNLSQAQHNKDA